MRTPLVFAVIVFLAWAGVGLAGPLADTKHDLYKTIKTSDTDETCIFCHTSHGGASGGAAPLWNQALTSVGLTWVPVTTVRGTALPTDVTTAAIEGSRACLSCHDGTVAVGSVLVNQSAGSAAARTLNVTGADITVEKLSSGSQAYINPTHSEKRDHPLAIPKPAAEAGFTNYVPSDGGTGVWYRKSSNNLQYVQCQSCHEPHDDSVAPFLLISNAAGAICKSCHDK